MNHFQNLHDKMKLFHNHICLVGFTRLVRLVGVGQDPYDMYYIVSEMEYPDGKTYWFTALTSCISFKDKLSEADYNTMDNIFEMNGSKKTEEFQMLTDNTEYDISITDLET